MTALAILSAFWLAAGVLGFAYLGYPLAMAALARLRPRPLHAVAWTPRIDVLLVAHNAEHQVEAKLRNLLDLDYPQDLLRIHLICDGCEDGTEAAARALESPRVRVVVHGQRRGKSACIADALPALDADVVLFTDVRQRVDVRAARALAAALADPQVGAVSGELVLEADNGYGRGIDAYWRYEKLLRRLESASGSIIGATGALYAAKRALLQAPPPGIRDIASCSCRRRWRSTAARATARRKKRASAERSPATTSCCTAGRNWRCRARIRWHCGCGDTSGCGWRGRGACSRC